ncbi:hypothetical protein [Nocardia brasiliensis]|uniref:hypothetical protein n=1 Tax=Nocardia brasiliensis TaxID=37326 RepID=UPI003672952C
MGLLYKSIATLTYTVTVIVIYNAIVAFARQQVFAELRGATFGDDESEHQP